MIVRAEIEEYVALYSGKETDLLSQLNQETAEKTNAYRMLSGEYQGRLLSLISKLVQPKVILEIGTFTGYSALCLAEGLKPNGILYTFDTDENVMQIAKDFFAKSTYAKQIIPILGNAKDKISTIKDKIDLAFIDADKKSYATYFDMILPMMNTGGIIIADNILWKGKVTEQDKDKKTQSLHEFNQKISEDSKVEVVVLPIRDGLSIIRVK
jgi:caffeoyl-CoA O-methyltransferase